MKKPIFYTGWLLLEKKQFRVMALLAVLGEYNGTLSEMCRQLHITEQNKNRNALQASIVELEAQGYLIHEQKARRHHLIPVPKGKAIRPLANVTQAIMNHEYTSENVAWEQVLKVYLWIFQNQKPLVTDAEMSAELAISTSTIGAAKNVLSNEFKILIRDIETVKLEDGSYRRIGQTLVTSAWWDKS